MVDRRKAFSLMFSRDHCQRSTPSRISDTPRAGFEPAQNLSSGFVEWSDTHYTTPPPVENWSNFSWSCECFISHEIKSSHKHKSKKSENVSVYVLLLTLSKSLLQVSLACASDCGSFHWVWAIHSGYLQLTLYLVTREHTFNSLSIV